MQDVIIKKRKGMNLFCLSKAQDVVSFCVAKLKIGLKMNLSLKKMNVSNFSHIFLRWKEDTEQVLGVYGSRFLLPSAEKGKRENE